MDINRFKAGDFHVGDELVYCVSRLGTRRSKVLGEALAHTVVTRVGRKWVYLSNDYRFDKTEDMIQDGYEVDGGRMVSPGVVYPSQEACESYHRVVRLVWLLKDKMQFGHRHEGVSPDDVLAAAKLLKVDLGEE